MDHIYRKEKYKQYLQRLQQLKGEVDDGTKIHEIRDGINAVLEDLRDKSDIRQNNLLYALLIIPLVIVLIWLNLHLMYIGWPFVPLILLVAFLVIANILMKNAIAENAGLKWKESIKEENETTFLLFKIKYLRSALQIKSMRSLLVQIFYYLFFPIFLYFLYQLVFGKSAFDNDIFGLFFAFLISFPLWFLFFKEDREDIDKTEEIISGYQSILTILNKHN